MSHAIIHYCPILFPNLSQRESHIPDLSQRSTTQRSLVDLLLLPRHQSPRSTMVNRMRCRSSRRVLPAQIRYAFNQFLSQSQSPGLLQRSTIQRSPVNPLRRKTAVALSLSQRKPINVVSLVHLTASQRLQRSRLR